MTTPSACTYRSRAFRRESNSEFNERHDQSVHLPMTAVAEEVSCASRVCGRGIRSQILTSMVIVCLLEILDPHVSGGHIPAKPTFPAQHCRNQLKPSAGRFKVCRTSPATPGAPQRTFAEAYSNGRQSAKSAKATQTQKLPPSMPNSKILGQ